jgi:hypothetical protein
LSDFFFSEEGKNRHSKKMQQTAHFDSDRPVVEVTAYPQICPPQTYLCPPGDKMCLSAQAPNYLCSENKIVADMGYDVYTDANGNQFAMHRTKTAFYNGGPRPVNGAPVSSFVTAAAAAPVISVSSPAPAVSTALITTGGSTRTREEIARQRQRHVNQGGTVMPQVIYKTGDPMAPYPMNATARDGERMDPLSQYRTNFTGQYNNITSSSMGTPLGLYPAQQQKKYVDGVNIKGPVYPQILTKYLWVTDDATGKDDGIGVPANFNFNFRSMMSAYLVPNSFEKQYFTWLAKVYVACNQVSNQFFPALFQDNSIGIVESAILCGFGEVLVDKAKNLSNSSALEQLQNAKVFENWSQFQSIISPYIRALADPRRITNTFQGKTVETLEFKVPEECRTTEGDIGFKALQEIFNLKQINFLDTDPRAKYPLLVQEVLISCFCLAARIDNAAFNTAHDDWKLTSFWPIVVELEQYIRQFYDPNAASKGVKKFRTSKAPTTAYLQNSPPGPAYTNIPTTVVGGPTTTFVSSSPGIYSVPLLATPMSSSGPIIYQPFAQQQQQQQQPTQYYVQQQPPYIQQQAQLQPQAQAQLQPMSYVIPTSSTSWSSTSPASISYGDLYRGPPGPGSGYVRGGYLRPMKNVKHLQKK